MAQADSETTDMVAQVRSRIRPAVRDCSPYVVGGIEKPPVKLNQNESPFDFPDELKREVIESFKAIPFNRYPEEQPGGLVRAFAQHAGCSPESVLAGNGSNELTYTLGLALVERGTPVVLPRPMFSLYEKVVRLFDGELVEVPCRDNLSFDTEAIVEAVRRHDPALTVLATPNNPTGLAMRLQDVEAVVAAASGLVVVDEAYIEFSEEPSALGLLEQHPNVIVLRTLSKACGLAGLRLGFMIGHPEVIREMMKARLPFMVDPLAETAGCALLRHPELLQERTALIKGWCASLARSLSEVDDVDVIPSQTNFIIFRTPLEPAALMGRLAASGVLVRNMHGYPELKGFLRVNAGTEAENNAFLVALKNALVDSR